MAKHKSSPVLGKRVPVGKIPAKTLNGNRRHTLVLAKGIVNVLNDPYNISLLAEANIDLPYILSHPYVMRHEMIVGQGKKRRVIGVQEYSVEDGHITWITKWDQISLMVFALNETNKDGLMSRIKRCAQCERWLYAMRPEQVCCSKKCRDQQFGQKVRPKKRKYMREYMRNYRALFQRRR